MTEIPEHLLKRSKERRAAMGLPGGEGDADASAPAASAPVPAAAAATPVAARAAAPEKAAPPPPKPLPPYVAAAKSRRRIPFWAMPVIALLPIWGLLYLNSVKVPPISDDALTIGAEQYAPCAQCHGANGEGGTGPALNNGAVLQTFKSAKDMEMWIYLGADGGARPDGTYGDANRPGGAHNLKTYSAAMPSHSDMSAEDLADVVRYVREVISGEETPDADAIAAAPEVAQEAIDEAKEGKLPSASTVKRAKGGGDAAPPTTVAGG